MEATMERLARLADPVYWVVDLAFDRPLAVAALVSALGVLVAFRMIG
jgi:hypothetical protein